MSYKLFSLKDGEIVINKVEILTIPPFKEILRRDTNRKKNVAFKEFAYIYHMSDVKGLPNRNGYDIIRAKEYSKSKAGLPDDWEADKVVLLAINEYKDEQESLPRNTIMELIKTYAFVGNVFGKIRVAIEELMKPDKLTKDQANEALNLIALLIEQGETIPKLTAKLTSAISQLEQLDDKENRDILRGSNSFVQDSAYPDRQL